MDNVRAIVGILFGHMPVEEILKGRISYDRIPLELFQVLANEYIPRYSNDEIRNLYSFLKNELKWERNKVYNKNDDGIEAANINVYDVLYLFGGKVLTEEDGQPVCQYIHLLRWHEMLKTIEEDSIITAYLACQDMQFQRKRKNFFWKPVIGHNSRALNKVMEKGLAENHFHLKGSAPLFHLSWLSLMNNVTNPKFQAALKEYDNKRLHRNVAYAGGYFENSLYHLYLYAALIRMYLFQEVKGISGVGEELLGYLYDNVGLEIRIDQLQDEIEYLQMNYGTKYDYAICEEYLLVNKKGHTNEILSGERWLMYQIFYKIYSKDKNTRQLANLFYIYLIIKSTIRAEVIQINENVGFDNFLLYQDRKEDFVENTIYEPIYIKMAVRDTMLNQSIKKLEARISPKDSAEENSRYIRKLEKNIWGENKENLSEEEKKLADNAFYVFHFIKQKDDQRSYETATCRHAAKREELRRKAWALAHFRENDREYANKVRGIDASASEIWCRPEVFAQAFRYLKEHRANDEGINLRCTFHVGEDFLDVVDGLRAIDEAISFLNLKCGDRLGHALALGIDVDEWYQKKVNMLLTSRMNHLDNLAWLYGKIRKFRITGCEDAMYYIEKRFDELIRIVYKEHVDMNKFTFSINSYYDAWKLRGDNPECYSDLDTCSDEVKLNIDVSGDKEWDYYGINREFPQNYRIRYDLETAYLYYLYQYSSKIKRSGDEMIEVHVNPSIIKAVKKVQKRMQTDICERGIGIETNPSSNCFIGSFKRYDKHPIVNWYNIGLTSDEQKLLECPQLLVSINTDDQGVFNTYLENEYAYMALALEKMKDSDGMSIYKRTMILRWLDNIRQMGLEQSFL